MNPKDYLCVALDTTDEMTILDAVDELKDVVGYFKIHAAFTMHGPSLLKKIQAKGVKVFLDLKFHDIPNTVGVYAEACAKLGVDMFNLHISGGKEMMAEAVKKVRESAGKKPKIIGVTVLTSLDDGMLHEMDMPGSIQDRILKYALLAKDAGLDGIVCSGADLDAIMGKLPPDFLYVTPGIRMPEGDANDQKRVFTPGNAVKAGSSLLVVGRPILGAKDRRKAAMEILEDIRKAM